MKQFLSIIKISIVATLTLGFVLTVVYPLGVWAVAQVAFSSKANGSLVEKDGKVVGSALLGQTFKSAVYFHSRPSAAGKGYDATSSSGSNLGPISGKFLDGIADDPKTKDADESFAGLKQRVALYRQENGLGENTKIPVDAVTASSSGLDPHISVSNAQLQMPRIARERGISPDEVQKLIDQNTEGRDFGILGEPGVNVLKINLALDQLKNPTQ